MAKTGTRCRIFGSCVWAQLPDSSFMVRRSNCCVSFFWCIM
nr:MAG TPA: hypothetical protein [Caudoviricetes sp.]DAJ61318.1 MAG TPA: hypothetical protein [Caudoviricetes sp.]DAK17715.1 MAG TPA: hypothetical protein [Caudoviricetes sp.]DAN49334.1 MAG TPA: hypothetical protein [Caudoviricetes sp.]DAP01599.1 MAG TPA: hypothetical protein [Caudoviricetes sp.]